MPTPHPSPEMGSYQGREVTPKPTNPERPVSPKIESQPQSKEQLEAQPTPASDPIAIPALPSKSFLPTPATDQSGQSAATSTTTNSNPLVAGDDDLIEKEWVEKAKKIVQDTKADPYAQEKEVSKLQADYIKKRYGKEIKLAGD